MRGLLDTSVFIAGEQGRALRTELLPDEAAVSIITVAELELGVRVAADEAIRTKRLRTLQAVQGTYLALAIDQGVASAFAELVAQARRHGRRPRVQDAWIAATAHAHGVPVFSQDRDFGELGVDFVAV